MADGRNLTWRCWLNYWSVYVWSDQVNKHHWPVLHCFADSHFAMCIFIYTVYPMCWLILLLLLTIEIYVCKPCLMCMRSTRIPLRRRSADMDKLSSQEKTYWTLSAHSKDVFCMMKLWCPTPYNYLPVNTCTKDENWKPSASSAFRICLPQLQ